MRENRFSKLNEYFKGDRTSSSASKAVEDTINKLDRVLKLRNQRYKKLDENIDQLKNTNDGLQKKNRDLSEELRAEKQKYSLFRQEALEDLDKAQKEFNNFRSRLENAHGELTQQNEVLKNKLNASVSKNKSLTNEVFSLTRSIEDIKQKNEDLQINLNEFESTSQEKIRRIQSEASRTVHQLKARHENDKRRLSALLKEAESKNEDLVTAHNEELHNIKLQNAHQTERNNELSRERDYLNQEISRLNSIVKSVQSTVDQLLSEEMKMSGVYDNIAVDMVDDFSINELTNSDILQTDTNRSYGEIDLNQYILDSAEDDIVRS